MPDHGHWLVEGLVGTSDFRQFVKSAKQRSGAAFAVRFGEPLWQEGYYDRVLRHDEDSLSVARYIVANPVRAGLVTDPSSYAYSGSDVWTMRELVESEQ